MSANAPVTETADLAGRYRQIRRTTERLCEPLSPEDCQAQSMADASPAKWHLAHTSWFFETFVLEGRLENYPLFRPEFRVLFNSYYQTVGPQHARPQRGLLTRPALDEVLAYRRHVDHYVEELLEAPQRAPTVSPAVVELGLQHEQQHQELILTDVKHLFAENPLRPAYARNAVPAVAAAPPLVWCAYDEGTRWIGHAGEGFAFDNEEPRHQVFVPGFALGSRLITNREFLDFIEDGGYRRPELWLSDGWSTVTQLGWRAPLYWEQRDGVWLAMTLAGLGEVGVHEPVCHVSYYEADAFARWAGARLPTEAEWEVVAAGVAIEGNFQESGLLTPAPAPSGSPVQLFGDVWEWTQSAYAAYPGYRPPVGALGEYNGKFMCNQLVLRGGSCVTPQSHMRATYRNFFPPSARWQFTGIRLARDTR